MRNVHPFRLIVAASLLLAAPLAAGAGSGTGDGASAESVTIEGTLLCAKCTLGEDREKCQDAISVADESTGTTRVYYLTANDAMEEAGHVCEEERMVRATGTLSDEDGQSWLTPTSIESLEPAAGAAGEATEGATEATGHEDHAAHGHAGH